MTKQLTHSLRVLGYVHEGRIHADINQIRSDAGGTVTGRFSMSNPNLQQIPSKGFIGAKMRELFVPEDGHKWGSFDYSQQEPRIVVHYAIKIGLPGTENLQEEFDKDDADFHQIVADMANISRKQAKTINLGLFYGMGKIKLQKELGLDQAKQKTYLTIGLIVDTMIAASVIDENRFKYSLDALSKDYLDESKYKYDLQQKNIRMVWWYS